ncbi:AP-1 complex subunit sigma-2 isoform X1 [Pelobates cultripes]|uniref:AP-1 complex subunit sigma-2 isoform X1 n=1 Tax=Pelobates cultripes TaxID=61616 RepID=A0AAD1QYS7_PELCU|nr:AP-1 complex subunit sigma-2 isoform X1 [Pelobates cultripes]
MPLGRQMQFMLLFSRQGKLRLQKWYVPLSDKEKKKITRELVQTVLARKPKMCSFLEWRDLKIVYKRYASLYFCCAIEDQDNELITLEIIHRYVELLDKYFGSVSQSILLKMKCCVDRIPFPVTISSKINHTV